MRQVAPQYICRGTCCRRTPKISRVRIMHTGAQLRYCCHKLHIGAVYNYMIELCKRETAQLMVWATQRVRASEACKCTSQLLDVVDCALVQAGC